MAGTGSEATLAHETVRSCPLFSGLDDATLDVVAGTLRPRRFRIDAAHGQHRLPWPYTQGELAGMIGGSRQSVNRLLADLVAEGLLRFDGDDLVIPDAARLAAAVCR